MDCGGNRSSQGQPGTPRSLARVPISHAELPVATMSAVPCAQRTGGLGSMSTMPAQLQYLPDSALRMPRVPGAMPGQCSDVVVSPGYPSTPVSDLRISSTSMSSRSAGSRWLGIQYELFMTLRGDTGDSDPVSCSAMCWVKSALPVPPPDPA